MTQTHSRVQSSYTSGRAELTLWNEGCDETRSSCNDIGGCERNPSPNALNGEEDQECSRELHQAGDEEVKVHVSSKNAQAHDQTLVHHGTCEPK